MTYLEETLYFDYSHPRIQSLINEFDLETTDKLDMVKRICLKVRDGWRYNPYQISLNPDNFRASTIAVKTDGHCIEKAIVLIACLRAVGVPARLRLAKVTNHIAVERLTERWGTNVLTPHGMVDIFLDGQWVKATPAFNEELCEKCNVQPLEFDGKTDAVFQEFNHEGEKFMEYLEDYGHFEDVPLDFMMQNLKEHYPEVFTSDQGKLEYRF